MHGDVADVFRRSRMSSDYVCIRVWCVACQSSLCPSCPSGPQRRALNPSHELSSSGRNATVEEEEIAQGDTLRQAPRCLLALDHRCPGSNVLSVSCLTLLDMHINVPRQHPLRTVHVLIFSSSMHAPNLVLFHDRALPAQTQPFTAALTYSDS
ncbi:hypothetical protein L226DRAFT_532709, partial [Lentinus tigrinus ALCF2SS1-7]|uniref:uncharacterized protein n=1 Tax=Lentinus tigrinus ALCF2SS1-7 TaxID=1328758 RepID=UPI001165F88B